MIGLVIVTHGRLAVELRSAMEHVVGRQANVVTVSIGADDDSDRRRSEIHAAVEQVDDGDGVVMMTDMFGGTPSNLCLSQMARPGVEVLAGVNLPMLVKLAKVRYLMPLKEAVECVQAAGRKYITSASEVLSHGKMRADGCEPVSKPSTTVAPVAPVAPIAGPRLATLRTGTGD